MKRISPALPKRAKVLAICLPAVVFYAGLAHAQAARTAGACAIEAWSTDRDPQGLPLRTEPDGNAPIVGRVPAPIEIQGRDMAVKVRIAASRDGWFLVREAAFGNGGKTKVQAVALKRPGWVPGAGLGVQIDAGEVRARPSPAAPIVTSLVVSLPNGKAWNPDDFAVQRLIDCKGGWVELEGKWPDGSTVRGWVERVCAEQEALCPSPLRGQHRSD